MMEPSQNPPRFLPLRLIALSAVAACTLLAWHGVPTSEWLRLLVGLTPIHSGGTTLATALFERCTQTLGFILGAACLSQAMSLAICLVSFQIGLGLPSLARFLGRLLALIPIVAVSWLAVGWIVGIQGLPIESLVPHHPVPGQDTFILNVGRHLWWWLLPICLLAIPMTGELVTETIPYFSQARESELAEGLRARGVRASLMRYRHWLPLVWPAVIRLLLSRGLLLFGYVVFVEEALGIQGWGSFFASAIKSGQVQNIAGAVYAAGWMAAVWCLCVTAFERLTFRSTAPPFITSSKPEHATPRGYLATAGCLLLLLGIGLSGGEIGALLSALVSPLVHDLGLLAASALLALLIAFILGHLLAFFHARPTRFPKTHLMVTLSWSPLLVYLLAVSPFLKQSDTLWIALGLGVGIPGAHYLHGRWSDLLSLPHVEAAYTLGSTRLDAWKLHVMPDMIYLTLSWTLKSFSLLLVWLVLIDGLSPTASPDTPATLGEALFRAKDNVLTDPLPLLIVGTLVSILALFFAQLSRIVHPTSTPH